MISWDVCLGHHRRVKIGILDCEIAVGPILGRTNKDLLIFLSYSSSILSPLFAFQNVLTCYRLLFLCGKGVLIQINPAIKLGDRDLVAIDLIRILVGSENGINNSMRGEVGTEPGNVNCCEIPWSRLDCAFGKEISNLDSRNRCHEGRSTLQDRFLNARDGSSKPVNEISRNARRIVPAYHRLFGIGRGRMNR